MNWSKAAVWLAASFGIALIVYEFWALFDQDARTPPITHIVIKYVPVWLAMPFFIWLPLHFGLRYLKGAGYLQQILGK